MPELIVVGRIELLESVDVQGIFGSFVPDAYLYSPEMSSGLAATVTRRVNDR